jgi:hypothetical protein
MEKVYENKIKTQFRHTAVRVHDYEHDAGHGLGGY